MVNLTVGAGAGHCSVMLATPPGQGKSRADGVIAAIGVSTVGRSIRALDHLGFVAYFAGGSDAVRPRAFVAGSDIVERMTPTAAKAIVSAVSAWPRTLGPATAVIESVDGATTDVDPTATAFPWRRRARRTGRELRGGYVNYLEPSTPAVRYFGANLPALADVRRRYDPGAVMFSSLDF